MLVVTLKSPWTLLPLPFGERAGVRGRASQSLQDHLKHAIHMLQDIIVPETRHAITHLFELLRARFVISQLLAMPAAVQPHNQARIRTDEIDDVRANFVPPAKFPSLQTPVTQVVPEPLLGVRLRISQAASSVNM